MSDNSDSAGAKVKTDHARAVLDTYSPRMFRLFSSYLEGYFARNFNAVRILSAAERGWKTDTGMVFFCNHPGWWDPILIILLAAKLTPGRPAFGPMEEAMLKKYAFMKRVGVFGVDRDSMRGAARFLAVGRGLMAEGSGALWLTPQGKFSDARLRPLQFEAGVARLARDTDALFVPMAIEYVFWNERKPEVLINFGVPVRGGSVEGRTTDEWNGDLAARLGTTMDDLSAAAIVRDAEAFDVLVKGRARVNPVYDAWRYLKAMVRGEKFSAAHEEDRS